jgi:DNA ligase-1
MDIRDFFGTKTKSAVQKSDGENNTQSKSNSDLENNINFDSKENCSSSNVPINGIRDNTQEEACNNKTSAQSNRLEMVESMSESETIGNVTWKSNESVPYAALVEIFETVANLAGRLDKEDTFCRLFKAVIKTTPTDLDPVVYLASNTLSPAYDGLELGIGDSLLVKAICDGIFESF